MKKDEVRRSLSEEDAAAWAAAGYPRDKAERWHDAGAGTPVIADSMRELGMTANEAAWPADIEGRRSSLGEHVARGSVSPSEAIAMVRRSRKDPPRACEQCGWPFVWHDASVCMWCEPAREMDEFRRLVGIQTKQSGGA